MKNTPSLSTQEVQTFFNGMLEKSPSVDLQKTKEYSEAALWYLNQGSLRIWDPQEQKVNAGLKIAVIEYFKSHGNETMSAGCFEYWDKLPVKSLDSLPGVRVVPGAVARYGSFIEKGCILMPSFINVGAYVGSGTMVDTWATVGSCAFVGSDVHLSGGVGIGGVLEPAQASPVVIESGAFLGSRAIVVEGVRVGEKAVLGAGVTLTASTKIVDVRGSTAAISTGFIPPLSVVIPGTLPKKFAAGEFGVPCALIIGTRSASTDLKTSLNDALREHQVAV